MKQQKDAIEAFIQTHRSAFDDAEPAGSIWSQIDRKLSAQKTEKPFRIGLLKIAASAVLLIGIGALLGGYAMHSYGTQQVLAESVEYQEYQRTEAFYVQQVDNRLAQIRHYGADEDIQDDLNQLDAVYQELKTELVQSNYQNKEQIIEAMIHHYNTKIDLLERILQRLEAAENPSDKLLDDETDRISI